MSFLNTFLLAGAAAFLVPLIIHLLNRRRIVVVKWGAMHLLQEVIKQRKRRVNIEEWLLLLLRIALPIILALCLARPVMTALRSLPGFGKTSLVVLLDDSFSMRAAGDSAPPLEQAKQALERIVAELPRGSDVQIVRASDASRTVFDGSTSALDSVPKALSELRFLGGPVNANEALQTAAAALAKAPNGTRELLVVSDFQQADWQAFAEGAPLPALEALQKQEPAPVLTFLRLNNPLSENLSLAAAELSAPIAAEGQPVGLRVRVKNHGKRLWQDIALHLEADGARIRTTRITVPGDGEVTTTFTHTFESRGDHALGVRIEGDTLADDNAAQAIVSIRRQVDVLLVDGSPGNEALSGSADFLELALAPHLAAASKMKDLIVTKKVEERRLRSEDLRGKEVIILTNIERLQGNRLSELDKAVNEGAGLLFFAGPQCDVQAMERDFYRGGKGLFPASVKGFASATESAPARILMQRFTHPAMTYFNDPRSGRLQDAEIKTWLTLDVANAKDTQVLMALDRGAPLLVERAHGQGRVIACATSATPEWSNLPLQSVFVPMMQRLVSYLSMPSAANSAQFVGSALQVGLPQGKGDEVFQLTDPAGKHTDVKARKEAQGVVIASPPVAEPGLYDLRAPGASDESAHKFAVNVHPAESALKALPASELETLAKRYSAGIADSFDAYQRLDRTRRHGSEVWQAFLVALVVLLFGEVLLQQRLTRA